MVQPLLVRRRAVTLMEVVVVASIVMLLASLAYPAFQRAREEAKRARSVSNMRQITMLLLMYTEAQPGEGPNRLGLPHQPFRWYDTNVPLELRRTGGNADGDRGILLDSDSLGFKVLIPDWRDDGQPANPHYPEVWSHYVDVRGGNPVWILDISRPVNLSLMMPRRFTGAFLDGHVESRWLKGLSDDLKHWK